MAMVSMMWLIVIVRFMPAYNEAVYDVEQFKSYMYLKLIFEISF